MDIAVIGGGFTGLTAAYRLAKQGHRVSVFEKEPFLGGLAYGFTADHWDWHLEGAYHHLFTNDTDIIGLIRELGLSDKLIVKRPVTASLWSGRMEQLDSPLSLLAFPGLPVADKIRTAFLLALLKLTPFWRPLESMKAEQLLTAIGGKRAFETIWKPLLYGKFGRHAPKVSAAWFWARIKKRTPKLCYIENGFHTVITALSQAIIRLDGRIHTGTAVEKIEHSGRTYTVRYGKTGTFKADRVLLTIPTPFAVRLLAMLAPQATAPYAALQKVPHLFAQTLIVETDRPILDRVYWLNVTDMSYPFLAAVAHTNFMDPNHYGGHHLTYFGNYLSPGHPYLSKTKEQLYRAFLPAIKRLSKTRAFSVKHTYMFVGPYAQSVHEMHYSKAIPPIATPVPGVYMANMDYIVPWDRGTNYAVELGNRAAAAIAAS